MNDNYFPQPLTRKKKLSGPLGSRRKVTFETIFKILEVIGLVSLGLIDVVISGVVWGLLINTDFYFIGIKISPSILGGMIAMAFWYSGFFIVRFIGKVLKENPGYSFREKFRIAFQDDRVFIGVIAAGILMFADIIGDSFSAIMMVFPNASVFNLIDLLKSGPPMMYFMMIVVIILTTLGEPIIYYRLIWLGIEEDNSKPAQAYHSKLRSQTSLERQREREGPPPGARRKTTNFRSNRKP